MRALKHLRSGNITQWWYDKDQKVNQLEATGVRVDEEEVKDLLVEATAENPRYKGVVNALKAQVTVGHKPFGLEELRLALEGAEMDLEREQAHAAKEKTAAK